MRPSARMVALVLALAVPTVAVVVLLPDREWLVALLWGALVLAVVADLLVTPPARRIQVQADLPATGFNGSTLILDLRLAARRLPRLLDLALHHDSGIATLDPAPLAPTSPDATRVSLPLQLQQRGERQVSRLSLRYASRLSLFEVIADRALDLKVLCLPDIGPVLSGAIHAQMLPLLDGARVMRLKGDGSEFHQLRDFVPGMDPRTIDWKRSARMRRMTARETRAERNHQIILCLDTGHLMAERHGALTKLDHAIHAGLALAWAGGLGGDNVGFYSFAARPQPFLPPAPGRTAFGRIRNACAALEASAVETNHTLGLSTLNGRLKRRSLVVVFSDFADSTSAELLVENLSVMQRQHLVLYVALRDPALTALTAPARPDMDSIAQAIAAGRMLQERQAVLDRLHRLGILCLDTTAQDLTGALISRYIEIKAKEAI